MIECLQQLTNAANQLPKITRDHMVQFASKSCEEVELNGESALKQLFILNALDGSEDYLVHQSLQDLVGKYQIIKEVTSWTLNLFFVVYIVFVKIEINVALTCYFQTYLKRAAFSKTYLFTGIEMLSGKPVLFH